MLSDTLDDSFDDKMARVEEMRLIVISVLQGDWGEAKVDDILRVLVSAAEELEAFIPDHAVLSLLVSKSTESHPRTLADRGPGGEIQITLSVEGRQWAQFAYQFGHELCHIFCDSATAEYSHPNLWFEETICEVASLFVLGRMAETWKANPPYPNWSGYASALQRYRDEYIERGKLPEGTALADVFREHEASLREDSIQRGLNLTMAVQLLPLFDGEPEHWEAFSNLNTVRDDDDRSFAQYLHAWSESAPNAHHKFIRQIADLLGVSF